jgi:APA family basic amino acid/polyamine antiporter
MSTQEASSTTAVPSAPPDTGHFARRATGLVREIRIRDSVIFNTIPGVPGFSLAIGIFFILSTFSQVNLYLSLLIAAVVAFVVSGAFGLLSQVMPRTGGDYVLVSRSLHPALGLASSLMVTFSAVLFVGYAAVATAQVALGPMVTLFGVAVDSPGLQTAGADIAGKQWLSMLIGAALIVIVIGIMIYGTRATMKLQLVLFVIAMLGLALGAIALLFTSRDGFVTAFNDFAAPFTERDNSYEFFISQAQEAGISTRGGTDLGNTIIASGAIIAFTTFSWWSVCFAGELRGGGTKRNWYAMLGGLAITFGSLLVMILLLYKTTGREFLTAVNGVSADTEVYTLPVAPYWVTLVAAIETSPVFVLALTLTFFTWGPLLLLVNSLQPVRAIFAWAFDQVIPARVAATSPRRNTPVVALVIVGVLAIACTYWAAYSEGFYEILSIVVVLLFAAFVLVGLSALVFPYRQRGAYEASSARGSIAGVPVMSLFGVAAVLAGAFCLWLFLAHPEFGLEKAGESFGAQLFAAPWDSGLALIATTFILGALLYAVAREMRRRQGIDISLNYREMPPE